MHVGQSHWDGMALERPMTMDKCATPHLIWAHARKFMGKDERTIFRLIDPCSEFISKLVRFLTIALGSWASPRRVILTSIPPCLDSNFTFFRSSSDMPSANGGSKDRGMIKEGSWSNVLQTCALSFSANITHDNVVTFDWSILTFDADVVCGRCDRRPDYDLAVRWSFILWRRVDLENIHQLRRLPALIYSSVLTIWSSDIDALARGISFSGTRIITIKFESAVRGRANKVHSLSLAPFELWGAAQTAANFGTFASS